MGKITNNTPVIMKFSEREFTPHQPYLEFNTNYYSYRPDFHDPLSGVVWEVYQVENFDIQKSIAFPDTCADLMVFYTKTEAYCYFMSGTLELRSMTELNFMKEVHTIFGVKFCTGALGNLFQCDVKDVGAGSIDAYDIVWNDKAMVEKIKEANSFTSRWELVSNYLIHRLNSNYEVNLIANYIAKSVIDNHGKIKIKELEEEMGYSSRYLRRVINDNMGASIKQICEVTQFQWLYHIYQNAGGSLSLAELAYHGGYYDQSHMNISCKKLTGDLPRKIMPIYM